MTGASPALELRGIAKRFGGTVALDDASLAVRAGTLHALLGENGAGKTTLMRVAFGLTRPDSGDVFVDGVARRWRSSADAIRSGIGMVHQHFMLVGAMTVAENVALGERGLLAHFDRRTAADRVRSLSAESGLALDPLARAADLTVGAQQRLEIIKALARNARLLILDEPTAVLTPPESRELYAWLRRFVGRGCTVVLITHKLREALSVADDVTVLRRGKSVLTARADSLSEDQVVRALLDDGYFDSATAASRPPIRTSCAGATVASLDRVSVVDSNDVARLRDVTLDVHAGEILGVAGVEGAGQHQLLRVLAGREHPSAGIAVLPRRIGFVQEDRLRDAVIPTMSLTENFALKEAGSRSGRMRWREYQLRTATVLRALDVRSAGPETAVGELSGGNQQKFVLGRALEGSPDLLVAENPLRGLDIRAAAHVVRSLREARESGVAVVVYSSDIDELLAMAERFVVCFGGRVSPVPANADALARALIGSTG